MVSKVPKVAVVTRTKDRPVLLERAIQSVHSQTMKDFIHVIYNDGGDASSVDALVEKYITLHQKVL
jgi:glycosyltransferase involved in cell wall biosynthesis